jgi:hypothetical protein
MKLRPLHKKWLFAGMLGLVVLSVVLYVNRRVPVVLTVTGNVRYETREVSGGLWESRTVERRVPVDGRTLEILNHSRHPLYAIKIRVVTASQDVYGDERNSLRTKQITRLTPDNIVQVHLRDLLIPIESNVQLVEVTAKGYKPTRFEL